MFSNHDPRHPIFKTRLTPLLCISPFSLPHSLYFSVSRSNSLWRNTAEQAPKSNTLGFSYSPFVSCIAVLRVTMCCLDLIFSSSCMEGWITLIAFHFRRILASGDIFQSISLLFLALAAVSLPCVAIHLASAPAAYTAKRHISSFYSYSSSSFIQSFFCFTVPSSSAP